MEAACPPNDPTGLRGALQRRQERNLVWNPKASKHIFLYVSSLCVEILLLI